MSNLNKDQFGDGDPYWSKQPDEALHAEHSLQMSWHEEHVTKLGVPRSYEWPVYKGHGDTRMAHEGIIARGREHEMRRIETEMGRRKIKPKRSLDEWRQG